MVSRLALLGCCGSRHTSPSGGAFYLREEGFLPQVVGPSPFFFQFFQTILLIFLSDHTLALTRGHNEWPQRRNWGLQDSEPSQTFSLHKLLVVGVLVERSKSTNTQRKGEEIYQAAQPRRPALRF